MYVHVEKILLSLFQRFLYLSRMKQKQDMENKIQELTDKNYRA